MSMLFQKSKALSQIKNIINNNNIFINNLNRRDVLKNAVNNVDKSSLWAP